MVGQIKCNIQALVKFESNDKREFEDTYLNTCRLLQEKSRECSKCLELAARNDHLQAKLAAAEESLSKLSEDNIAYLEEVNEKEDRLKRLQKMQLKQETELKDKILRLEQEILKKDQQIKQLKKEAQEVSDSKFVNEEEGYELLIRKAPFSLGKFQKHISLSCQALLSLITQEVHH
jgi:chromosome segregation ATPase